MGISVEAAEGLTLTIHHNAFYNDKDISEDEVIRGLKEGAVINPADYAWEKDTLTYLGSIPEEITIGAESDNKIELFYDETPVEREEDEIQILNAVPRY